MKALDSASPETAVSRLKERLSHSWSHPGEEPSVSLPAALPNRRRRFPANIAEFLLVFRLLARRAKPSSEMLERAVQVVMVTCRHWFGDTEPSRRESQRRH